MLSSFPEITCNDVINPLWGSQTYFSSQFFRLRAATDEEWAATIILPALSLCKGTWGCLDEGRRGIWMPRAQVCTLLEVGPTQAGGLTAGVSSLGYGSPVAYGSPV